jgi:hypothetical protein
MNESMNQRTRVFFQLAILLTSPCAFSQTPIDACEAKLPASLRESLMKRFPQYWVAKVTDSFKEDVEHHKENFSGDPCLSVASADVDGDGSSDFAIIITQRSKHTLLVAARNVSDGHWAISKLLDLGNEGPARSYVDPLPADSYEDMFATDRGPSDYVQEPGRVKRYKAIHPGFIAGTIEASGVGYFFNGKQWVHLWLSD